MAVMSLAVIMANQNIVGFTSVEGFSNYYMANGIRFWQCWRFQGYHSGRPGAWSNIKWQAIEELRVSLTNHNVECVSERLQQYWRFLL